MLLSFQFIRFFLHMNRYELNQGYINGYASFIIKKLYFEQKNIFCMHDLLETQLNCDPEKYLFLFLLFSVFHIHTAIGRRHMIQRLSHSYYVKRKKST